MKSRKHYRTNFTRAIAESDPEGVRASLDALIFYGAGVSEPRGVADARLSNEELNAALDVLRSGGRRCEASADWIFNHLMSSV